MSQSSRKAVPLLLALMLVGGCILGPQPEPPDLTNGGAGNRDCDPDAEYDDDCDCEPTDDDGDGFVDCDSAGVWTGEDGCPGPDGDSDIDDPADEAEPPFGHSGDDSPVAPTQDLVQWPVDPSIGLDDDSDTVVID